MADQTCRDDDARMGALWIGGAVLFIGTAVAVYVYKNEREHEGIYGELDGIHRFDMMIAEYVKEHGEEHMRLDNRLDALSVPSTTSYPPLAVADTQFPLTVFGTPWSGGDRWSDMPTLRDTSGPLSGYEPLEAGVSPSYIERMGVPTKSYRPPPSSGVSRAVLLALDDEMGAVTRPAPGLLDETFTVEVGPFNSEAEAEAVGEEITHRLGIPPCGDACGVPDDAPRSSATMRSPT